MNPNWTNTKTQWLFCRRWTKICYCVDHRQEEPILKFKTILFINIQFKELTFNQKANLIQTFFYNLKPCQWFCSIV